MESNLLLLPGNAKRSGEWLRQVDSALAPLFAQTYLHEYAHWEHNEPEIDLEKETERLREPAKALQPYVLFAKSAGTILTSKATAEGVLQPTACLFAGFPLVMLNDQHLPVDEWLQATTFPLTILQHTADPYGSFKDVSNYIAATARPNISMHELPGDTHDYLEFDLIKDFMKV